MCSAEGCSEESRATHRAVQHPPDSPCSSHRRQLLGMNKLYPDPLKFHQCSSQEDTEEACRKYKVKPPSLNAALFERLLRETEINAQLQETLVRGWREGLDLGSKLPREDHFVGSPIMNEEKTAILETSLLREKEKGRLKGPFKQPIRDGKWFKEAWVSPYFIIPKSKHPEAAGK